MNDINTYIKIKKTNSCMLANIEGLSDGNNPKENLLGICKVRGNGGEGFLTFCGPTEDSYAQDLAAYIRKNRLGPVTATRVLGNDFYHGEGRPSQVFVWHPNDEALTKWWTKNKPKGERRSGANKWL